MPAYDLLLIVPEENAVYQLTSDGKKLIPSKPLPTPIGLGYHQITAVFALETYGQYSFPDGGQQTHDLLLGCLENDAYPGKVVGDTFQARAQNLFLLQDKERVFRIYQTWLLVLDGLGQIQRLTAYYQYPQGTMSYRYDGFEQPTLVEGYSTLTMDDYETRLRKDLADSFDRAVKVFDPKDPATVKMLDLL